MSNGKVMIIHLIVRFITKILYKWVNTFPNHRDLFGRDISVKVD